MKEVDKKDTPNVSGGYFGPITDPVECPTLPDPEYPQYPNGDPLGTGDLPVGSR